MNLLTNRLLLGYLELALIMLAALASLWAYILIRMARRHTDPPTHRPVYMPSTALTRESRKRRVRQLTVV